MGTAQILADRTGDVFPNRRVAGIALARHLMPYARRPDLIVLAVPRGGVPVAYEVARALDAPLDVFVVRKLGLPGHVEMAMGAVASGDVVVLNRDMIRTLGISESEVSRVLKTEQLELKRREHRYRDDRAPAHVTGKTVILVDDGLATGASMVAAIAALRQNQPARLIVAVPIGAPDTCRALRERADEVVCAVTPEPFYGVGAWYKDFGQTTDDEVRTLLHQASRERIWAHARLANRIGNPQFDLRSRDGDSRP